MVKRWLELGLSGIKSTHTRTHTHTLINPKPLIPNPNRRVTHEGSPCGGSACGWCVGVPVRLAPWTSHLEGNFCAFWPANSGSHEREPQLNWHIQSILICQQKKKNLWPATLEWERKKKKKKRLVFAGDLLFIPEQLEDTSLNVLPRELSKSHPLEIRDRDQEGTGVLTMQ